MAAESRKPVKRQFYAKVQCIYKGGVGFVRVLAFSRIFLV
jgi:hypothetical protein